MARKPKNSFRKEHYLPKRKEKRPIRGAAAIPLRSRVPFFLAVFLWILFLGTGVYVLFFSSFLVVQEAEVIGNEKIGADEVKTLFRTETEKPLLYLFSRRNYFLLDEKKLTEKIREEYPEVENVSLHRFFPNSLVIRLEERPLGVLWCSRGPCYLLDRENKTWEGHLAEEKAGADFPLFRVTDTSGLEVVLGEQLFDYPYVALLKENLARLEEGLLIPVEWQGTSASRFSDELRLRTKAGWELYLNTRQTTEENEKTLRLFFEKELPFERQGELRYVDLRAENRIYYALKGDEGKTEEDKKKEEEEEKAEKKKEVEKKKEN